MAELSIRYATALFELALESNCLDDCITQAQFLIDMLHDTDFKNMMEHPTISTIEKHDFVQTVFGEQFHPNLVGFLKLIVMKNREITLHKALSDFIEMGKNHKRMTKAEVVTAHPLSEKQLSELRALLSRKLNKHVEISMRVDPAIIGGLLIHVDGLLIDSTIKKQLANMKNAVKRSWLNDSKTG